jgi:hypothetical protein
MSSESKEELIFAISEWNKYKNQISELEKKMEKYKSKVIQYMTENDLETINTDNFVIKSTKCSRESLSKKDLPKDIWNQYCKNSSYYIYKIVEKK